MPPSFAKRRATQWRQQQLSSEREKAASVYQQRRPPPPARMREKAPPSANFPLGWPPPKPPVLAERKKNSLFLSFLEEASRWLSLADGGRSQASPSCVEREREEGKERT